VLVSISAAHRPLETYLILNFRLSLYLRNRTANPTSDIGMTWRWWPDSTSRWPPTSENLELEHARVLAASKPCCVIGKGTLLRTPQRRQSRRPIAHARQQMERLADGDYWWLQSVYVQNPDFSAGADFSGRSLNSSYHEAAPQRPKFACLRSHMEYKWTITGRAPPYIGMGTFRRMKRKHTVLDDGSIVP